MKICFVAQHIYACLTKSDTIKTIGGAELQQIFIGKGLRDRGYEVSYISLDYGQEDGQIIDSMKVYTCFKPQEGIFGIRFVYPRLYKIWLALKRANADIYYVRCAGFLPGILAIFCRRYNKKFVFAGAHDTDFIPDKLRLPTTRDKILYKYGLRRAHAIIVQSNVQRKLLWENFALRSKVFRNFYPCAGVELPYSQRKHVLWVSTIRDWKRPVQFIRLAESFPSQSFVMIGGPPAVKDRTLYSQVEERAQGVENLRFLGFQPLEVTERYFDKSKLFVNTSEYEGFPNTFLQAWSRGIPVMSYVDPDNVIKDNKLGLVVGSEDDLRQGLSAFLSRPSWNSGHIVDYFNHNHSQRVINEYCPLLDNLLRA